MFILNFLNLTDYWLVLFYQYYYFVYFLIVCDVYLMYFQMLF